MLSPRIHFTSFCLCRSVGENYCRNNEKRWPQFVMYRATAILAPAHQHRGWGEHIQAHRLELCTTKKHINSSNNALQIAFNILSICLIWPNFRTNCLNWPQFDNFQPIWQFCEATNSYFVAASLMIFSKVNKKQGVTYEAYWNTLAYIADVCLKFEK